ncbi:RNA-directed DNA polymerase, eukaryota, reverse transcriptase zinc-binding domain protein [Tanacetum coccineum]
MSPCFGGIGYVVVVVEMVKWARNADVALKTVTLPISTSHYKFDGSEWGGVKRCALKIDIAKAYDTLYLYVSMVKSMTRGLRQEDHISPYLFTLGMKVFTLILAHKVDNCPKFKYHAGCKELKLTHLCIADDLLVMCHGSVDSIKFIKDSLDDFSRVLVEAENNDSWMWKVLLDLRKEAKKYIEYKVGNGNMISICNNHDKPVWRCNDERFKDFSVKQNWEDYREINPEVRWKNLVWFSQCIHSLTVVLWIAIKGKLQTQDKVFLWNNDANMRCHLCTKCMDSYDHLFVQCNYAIEFWDAVKIKGYVNGLKHKWNDTIDCMASNHCKAIKSVVSKIVFGAVVYYLLQKRNKRYFTNEKRSAKTLSEVILDTVKVRLLGLRVKNSVNVQNVAKAWGIQFKINQAKMVTKC